MLFSATSFFQALPLIASCVSAARPAVAAQHVALHRRQVTAPTAYPTLNSTTSITTYTVITPSPSASPVAVTSLSQLVTSYVPQVTLCAISSSSTNSSGLFTNTSSTLAQQTPTPTDCTTSYSETVLTICATTLQGLGSTVAITHCSQQVTFSSQYGYSLLPASSTTSSFDGTGLAQTTITAPPSIETITSFYVAPWQALTTQLGPMNVTERVCSTNLTQSTSQCIDIFEIWSTTTITSITSFTSVVDFTTTIGTNASLVIVETITASLAESETFYSLSTTMVLTTSTESLATATTTVNLSTSTIVVYPAPEVTSTESEYTSTSTTTVTRTSYFTTTETLTTVTESLLPAATAS